MKNETKTRAVAPAPEAPDFQELVNLLAVYSEASSRLAEIETAANAELLQLIDEHKDDYAKLQDACNKAHDALETICRSHPEWFAGARSIKTPYGRVALRSASSLDVKDDEATVKLLQAEHERTKAQRAVDGTSAVFAVDDYIRVVQVPNLEALEKLDDATLGKFMVKRVVADTFKVTPAELDFGKAVKDAAAKQN